MTNSGPLVWDELLARVAQNRASQCIYAVNPNRGSQYNALLTAVDATTWYVGEVSALTVDLAEKISLIKIFLLRTLGVQPMVPLDFLPTPRRYLISGTHRRADDSSPITAPQSQMTTLVDGARIPSLYGRARHAWDAAGRTAAPARPCLRTIAEIGPCLW